MSAARNGRIGLTIFEIGVPSIPEITKSMDPTGGVIPPDMMVIMNTIENCIMSIPMACTTGTKIGVRRSIVAVPSTKHPATMQITPQKSMTPKPLWMLVFRKFAMDFVTPSRASM